MPWAEVLVLLLSVYSATGIIFAVAFAWKGAPRVDAGARHAGLAFRLLVLPGSVAFWPLLALRWVRS